MSAASPLLDSSISEYPDQLDPTLMVNGATLTGAAIDAAVTIGGESYELHVVMTVDKDSLVVTQWTMAPQ